MVGYDDEDKEFVFELTFNYGIPQYSHGNDFVYTILNVPQVRKCHASCHGCANS